MAELIKYEETNYSKFTNEQLRNRLNYYSKHDVSENEIILDKLIDFDSAQLVEGDREPLIKFLKILDDLANKKITIQEAEQFIIKNDLKPIGTNQINKLKKEETLRKIQAEQEKINKFNKYCLQFDNAIELLFKTGLEDTAISCIKYKPNNIEGDKTSSDAILKLINDFTENNKIVNVRVFQNKFKNLDTFLHYQNFETDNKNLKTAISYVKKANNTKKKKKEEQRMYKINIADNYPSSIAGIYSSEEADIVSIIMTKTTSKDNMVKNLIKLEEYKISDKKEKFKISTILQYFNQEDVTDKAILQAMVKNIYLKNKTIIKTAINKEQTLFTDSTLGINAKNAIYEDKLFPNCLKYFEIFEKAMSRTAQAKNEDGIQFIGSNNKTLKKMYKQEVKVPMDERLYSVNGDYVFDVYKPGLHKLKITKA